MSEARVQEIKTRITDALAPESLEIIDESHLHAGHAGARDGGGHFAVTVVAQAFAGQNTMQRHRMIYAAVGNMMQRDIHALSIKAFSPDEI